MRVVLFGAGNKGTQVLKKLIELKQDVIGVVYLKEEKHENIWYRKIEWEAEDSNILTISHKNVDSIIINVLKPDVIFVVGWRYKINKDIYSIPPKGTIVFHDSLLPKYRGFAPMNWAIINGEEKTGATMFYIADDIDSGDIIAQKQIYIHENDTAKTLEQDITKLYLDMLEENLIYIADKPRTYPQDHSQATYTCKRIPEDGLIDWTKSSWEIYNLIRGLSYPYPNAFTYLDGTRVYIKKASLVSNPKNYAGRVCGRVVNIIKGKGVEVLTGDGSIIIEKINNINSDWDADKYIGSIKDTFGR